MPYREARRHNALIRPEFIDEPLKPLLRPLVLQDQTASPTISPRTPSTIASSATRINSAVTGRSPDVARSDKSVLVPLSSGHGVFDLPKPSTLFPRDIETLLKMSSTALGELLEDYGLRAQAQDPSTGPGEDSKQAKPSGTPTTPKGTFYSARHAP